MVTMVSFVIAVVEAVVIMSLRDVISYAFTEGDTVAKAVSDLCPYLAVTLVLNGIQPVLSGKYSERFLVVKLVYINRLDLGLISSSFSHYDYI